MKRFFYIFFIFCLAVACRDDKKYTGTGYLIVKPVQLSVDAEVIPLTRSVDAGLQIQILHNGILAEGQDYAPGTDFSKRIVLPAGEGYSIKAFTPDQTEAADGETGHPVYSVESTVFKIEDADITTVSLIAPQVNVGIKILCDESFAMNFTDISVTITSETGRTVVIQGTEESDLYYFNLPASAQLNYTIQAKNQDGEKMEKDNTLSVTAKNYTIRLSI